MVLTKILLWGPALWAKTGYGKNLLNIGLRFKEAGHEVAQFAFSGLRWGQVDYKGITVFPNGAEDYGQTWLTRWNTIYKPDIIIFHYDAWQLSTAFKGTTMPILWYVPVDHSPLPPPLKQSLEHQGNVVAYSRFGQKEFHDADIEAAYIPHAYDEKMFKRGDMMEARRAMRLPEDAFIMTSVAANKGPRKNYGGVLFAFRKFLDRCNAWDDAFLYLHCNMTRAIDNPMGYELMEIWDGLGITERIKYVHPIYYESHGFTETEMANIYRASDWHILCSLGEGFGMPLMEALACGTPSIYGNYSAMPEVVGPGGLPVNAVERMPFELTSSFQWIPSTEQIADRMCEAYEDWKGGSKMRNRLAKKGSLYVRQNYTYKKVMPQWESHLTKDRQPLVELPAWKPREEGEVDIIVISWNGLEMLKNCIDSIYAYTNIPFHLVVVNDQSTDGTHEYMLEKYAIHDNITYVRPETKAKGGSEIMNQGYKRCRNDFIVSMNNDITVTDGWLEEAMKVMELSPTIGVVGMKFLWPWDQRIQHAGGTFIKDGMPCHIGEGEPKEAHSETRKRAWVSGPCVLIRREVLDPGWEEDYDSFGGHEDVDLCLRCWQMGYKVMFCGSAMVYHNEGVTVTKMPNFPEMFERNRTVFYSKWRGNKLLAELAKL